MKICYLIEASSKVIYVKQYLEKSTFYLQFLLKKNCSILPGVWLCQGTPVPTDPLYGPMHIWAVWNCGQTMNNCRQTKTIKINHILCWRFLFSDVSTIFILAQRNVWFLCRHSLTLKYCDLAEKMGHFELLLPWKQRFDCQFTNKEAIESTSSPDPDGLVLDITKIELARQFIGAIH